MPIETAAPAGVASPDIPIKPDGTRASTLLTVGTIASLAVVSLVTFIFILAVPVRYWDGSPTTSSPCPYGTSSQSSSTSQPPAPSQPPSTASSPVSKPNTSVAVIAGDWRTQLLALVNKVRADINVGPVCLNEKLNIGSQSQSESGKYGHTWDFLYALHYDYRAMGQNIAKGQTSAESVFYAWFNEPPDKDGRRGHRDNILNPAYNQMGAGWTTNDNMWTQNFGYSDTEPCV